MVRILDIWNERKVYSPIYINELKARLGLLPPLPFRPTSLVLPGLIRSDSFFP